MITAAATMNGTTPAATLRISSTLALPLDALTQTFALIGKRGTGKTNGGVDLTEEFIEAGLPVCVIDPVGVWWGLRASADGKGPGLPVVIFGGSRADIPIDATQGAAAADFVIDANRPTILDLSEFSKADRIRFMADFAEHLFWKKASRRDPLHLMVDECDEFAPQQTRGEGGNLPRLLGAMEALIRRGRSRGIGMTMITQRPAVLNKNVLTQAECLVVFQLTAPQDRKAIDDWVRSNAEPGQIEVFDRDLTKLPQGHAFVWSPVWLKVFQRVHFRLRRTFDSSSTPTVGTKAIVPRMLAPIEIDELREKFAIAREQLDENDPDELRARIAVLELELDAAKTSKPAPERVEVRVPFVPKAVLEAAARVKQRLSMVIDDLRVIDAAAGDGRPIEFLTDPPASRDVAIVPKSAQPPPAATPVRHGTTGFVHAHQPAARLDAGLGSGERAILTVLHLYGPMNKVELAVRTLYKHSGGGFGNYVSALRSAGLVAGDASKLAITAAGKAQNAREPLPTGRELVAAWLAKVPGGSPRKCLEELVAVHPRKLTKEALAHRVGYEPTGGGFGNGLSMLRSIALAKGKREIGLSDALAAAIAVRS